MHSIAAAGTDVVDTTTNTVPSSELTSEMPSTPVSTVSELESTRSDETMRSHETTRSRETTRSSETESDATTMERPPVACSQASIEPLQEAHADDETCREKCSVSYCSEISKHRLCSAAG